MLCFIIHSFVGQVDLVAVGIGQTLVLIPEGGQAPPWQCSLDVHERSLGL